MVFANLKKWLTVLQRSSVDTFYVLTGTPTQGILLSLNLILKTN